MEKNKWLIRAAGLIIVFMGIAFAQVFGVRELFKVLSFSITSPEIIILIGLLTIVSPNNDDVVNALDKLSKAGTRLLLAKAGVNYDAREQEGAANKIITSDQQKTSDQSIPPSQGK